MFHTPVMEASPPPPHSTSLCPPPPPNRETLVNSGASFAGPALHRGLDLKEEIEAHLVSFWRVAHFSLA